jgi:hypothetical protein
MYCSKREELYASVAKTAQAWLSVHQLSRGDQVADSQLQAYFQSALDGFMEHEGRCEICQGKVG